MSEDVRLVIHFMDGSKIDARFPRQTTDPIKVAQNIRKAMDLDKLTIEMEGQLMLIPLGLFTFLSLRKLQGTGFHLIPRRADWRPALESFLYGSPLIAIVALSTGYVHWNPRFDDPAYALLEASGKLLGIYLTTALAEEFLLLRLFPIKTSFRIPKS